MLHSVMLHSVMLHSKVAHITETKGQIKLRFRTAAGKDVVSVRNFSLTQKTSKMEFKAIESVLQTINSTTGERVSLSYRCADMDREIPLLMGVPKAVLENVIFVHQDDANWPLAEPALLKKKFDDIFSATKYTKALEALKKVHKEQAQLIKEMKLKAENLRNILDTSLRLQEGIKADSGQSERLAGQIERLEGQIAERRARQGEVESGLARLRQLKADLQTQEGRLELLSRQKVQQRANIMSDNDDLACMSFVPEQSRASSWRSGGWSLRAWQRRWRGDSCVDPNQPPCFNPICPRAESDEKLEEWRREFEGVVGKLEGSLAKTTRELSELRIQQEAERESSERDRQLVSRLQVEKEVPAAAVLQARPGRHRAWAPGQQSSSGAGHARSEQAGHAPSLDVSEPFQPAPTSQVHERDCNERDRCLQQLYSNHDLGDIGPVPLASDEAVELGRRAASTLTQLQQRWDEMKRGQQEEERRRGAEIEAAGGEIVKAEGQLQMAQERKKAEADRLATKLRDPTLLSKLEDAKTDLSRQEQRLKALQREKDSLAAESSERVTLRLKQEAVREKEAQLKKLLAENKGRIEEVLGGEMPSETSKLVREVEKAIRAQRVVYEEADVKAKEAGNEAAVQQQRLDHARSELNRHSNEMDSEWFSAVQHGVMWSAKRVLIQTRLSKAVDPSLAVDDLERVRGEKRTALEEAIGAYETFVEMKKFVAQFEQVARRRHCCPTCERGFSREEEEQFVEKIKNKNRNAGNKEAELKREREGLAQKLGILDDLHPVYNEYRKLVDELVPRARVVVGHVEEAQSKAQENHENLLCLLAEAKAKLDAAGRVELIVKDAERVRKEAENGEAEVQELEYRAEDEAGGEEVQELQYRLNMLSQAMRSLADVNADLAAAKRRGEEWEVGQSEEGGGEWGKAEVQELEYRLDTLSQAMRSLADVYADLAAAEEKRDAAAGDVERLREEHAALKDEAAAASNRWRGAREERAQMALRVARRREMEEEVGQLEVAIEGSKLEIQMEEEVGQLEVAVEGSKLEIQALERSMGPLRKKHGEAVEGRRVWREKAGAEEAEMQGRVRGMERDLDGTRAIFKKIEE
ncbi:unnamed protein product [Closterium sp. NIES-65]|nr:unnamed protein product [Closterium sp. NIES-65]